MASDRQLRPRAISQTRTINHSRNSSFSSTASTSSSASSTSSSTSSSFSPSPPPKRIEPPELPPPNRPLSPAIPLPDLLSNATDAGYDDHAPDLAGKPSDIDKIAAHLGLSLLEIEFVRRHLRTVLQLHPAYMSTTAITSITKREEFCHTMSQTLRKTWNHGQIMKYCHSPHSNVVYRRNALYRLVLVERKLMAKRGIRDTAQSSDIDTVKSMVAEAVAAASENVIALAHRLVLEAKETAAEEARETAAKILQGAGNNLNLEDIQNIANRSKAEAIAQAKLDAETIAIKMKDEAILEAARLAAIAKNEAILEAARLAAIAKEESILEAARLAIEAKDEAIIQAGSLATAAKDEAISYTNTLSVAQDKLSDAIVDIAASHRQIMQKLDSRTPSSTPGPFRSSVYARLFPSERPTAPTVTVSGSKITVNHDGRAVDLDFTSVAAANTSNRVFSLRFLKLANEVLEGRAQLVILLGDSGTGKTFTTTGPEGLVLGIFGRVLSDVADAEWTSATLVAKEYSGSGEHQLAGGVRTAETSSMDPDWISTWLTEVTSQRATQATALNKSSSRRHTSFRLQLKRAAKPHFTDITICDMAGYERHSLLEPTVERVAIHSALLKLGEILRAISEERFESFLVRGNSLTEGLRGQLIELGFSGRLTTIVTLDQSDAERCMKMLGIVREYLPGLF